MLDSIALLKELVAIPGPPGDERAVCAAVQRHVTALGFDSIVDAKGNLVVQTGGKGPAKIVVTAHLDEIGLIVTDVWENGTIKVAPLGGVHPFKWGEQPVSVLAKDGPINGVLSYGSVHTTSSEAVSVQAQTGPVTWGKARVLTGYDRQELALKGVRPGVRVVMGQSRREVLELGNELVASYFIDDRADLVAMLLALESIRDEPLAGPVVFAATAAEEVGGEGAQYLLHRLQPDICLALEIGPSVVESPFAPDERPTIWVNDSYSAMSAKDGEELEELCRQLGIRPHWQALSRGGSDASCAASKGLTARPITFGLAVENSHGFEIMHKEAPRQLARLLLAYLRRFGAD